MTPTKTLRRGKVFMLSDDDFKPTRGRIALDPRWRWMFTLPIGGAVKIWQANKQDASNELCYARRKGYAPTEIRCRTTRRGVTMFWRGPDVLRIEGPKE